MYMYLQVTSRHKFVHCNYVEKLLTFLINYNYLQTDVPLKNASCGVVDIISLLKGNDNVNCFSWIYM